LPFNNLCTPTWSAYNGGYVYCQEDNKIYYIIDNTKFYVPSSYLCTESGTFTTIPKALCDMIPNGPTDATYITFPTICTPAWKQYNGKFIHIAEIGAVYYVHDNMKYPVPMFELCTQAHSFEDIPPELGKAIPDGPTEATYITFPNICKSWWNDYDNKFIRDPESGRIYLLSNNKKHYVPSPDVCINAIREFTDFPKNICDMIPDGPEATYANFPSICRPSWEQYNDQFVRNPETGKIYLIKDTKKYPVPDFA